MDEKSFSDLGKGSRWTQVNGKRVDLIKKYEPNGPSYTWQLPEDENIRMSIRED